MKIGIDATFSPHGGSLGHLLEFIKGFSKVHSKSDLILYTKKENVELLGDDIASRCTLRIVREASYGNFFRILWGQFLLPFLSKRDRLDVLFCPGNISPLVKTTEIKAQWIATVGPFEKDTYSALQLRDKFLNIVNKYFILLSGYSSNIVIHESFYSQQLFEKKYRYPSRNQFLIEAVVICQLGGIAGIILGVAAGNITSIFTGSSFIIPWLWILSGVALCIFVGLVSGIFPAAKAAKLDPIEALRYE